MIFSLDKLDNRVVYNGKQGCLSMSNDVYGFELPLLLFGGFRSIIDELHAELARRGHPELRPAHGFALQAIGLDGATATEAGRRLGISKQAAGKTIDRLEAARLRRSAPATTPTGGASWPGSPRAASRCWPCPR